MTFSPFGNDLFGMPIVQRNDSPVAQQFLMPPFSVLSARDGLWQDRKRAWLKMGIKGEVGRDKDLLYGEGVDSLDFYRKKEGIRDTSEESNTSVFDPVLCELMYSWFNPKGGQIIDPFAGGSVRGVVASCLGMDYWGCELRPEQVDENRLQIEALCKGRKPRYVCGDSRLFMDAAPQADFMFSCPPYGDLEVYSDDKNDLSNMKWDDFVSAYGEIIGKSCQRMKENRFACFIVGDFRDPKGFYRNMISLTTSLFDEHGMHLYNEGILVTPVGSASMRVTKQFEVSRKFAKTHQNILIFCNGDPKLATQAINKGAFE